MPKLVSIVKHVERLRCVQITTAGKKTHMFGATPGAISPIFFGVILHCRSSLIFLVLSKAVQVWEVIINIAFAMSRKQCSGCNCPLTHAVDGRNLRCGTIGSCQSTTAFEIVK